MEAVLEEYQNTGNANSTQEVIPSMKPEALMHKIESGAFDTTFHLMYGTAPGIIADQKKRYLDAIRAFSAHYPQRQDVEIGRASCRERV